MIGDIWGRSLVECHGGLVVRNPFDLIFTLFFFFNLFLHTLGIGRNGANLTNWNLDVNFGSWGLRNAQMENLRFVSASGELLLQTNGIKGSFNMIKGYSGCIKGFIRLYGSMSIILVVKNNKQMRLTCYLSYTRILLCNCQCKQCSENHYKK